MDFLKLATERYSVRKFTDKHLEQDVLDKILQAGHVAPTGCNYQPQRILVLNTDESVGKLKNCTPCHFNAPTAMIICYKKSESWVSKYDNTMMTGPIDASIVATHMMLMAESIGVGTCMVLAYNPDALRETYQIPDDYVLSTLLVMGYPHPDATPLDLHAKYRPMDEVVFYEKF